MSSSRCGRKLSFPASVKTEDSEYLLLHSTKEKLQAGLMCSDFLSPSFGCFLRVLAPGVSPGFVASAVLNRIRGFRDFNSVNLYEQQLVFISSFVVSMFDVLHTVINSVYVQNLPTEQANSCHRFFSRCYDPYTHGCKARPLTTVGRTSWSVIIIIINATSSVFALCVLTWRYVSLAALVGACASRSMSWCSTEASTAAGTAFPNR